MYLSIYVVDTDYLNYILIIKGCQMGLVMKNISRSMVFCEISLVCSNLGNNRKYRKHMESSVGVDGFLISLVRYLLRR